MCESNKWAGITLFPTRLYVYPAKIQINLRICEADLDPVIQN